MTNRKTLINIIKYFAKFPDKQGVLEHFTKTSSDISGYSDLKDYVTNLDPGLMSDIKYFLFGINDERLSEKIRDLDDFFMLIEYGVISASSEDRANTRDTTFDLSVIIGHPTDRKADDFFEWLILDDQCLDLILDLKELIQDDDDAEAICGNEEFLDSNIIIAPIEPALIHDCVAWTMSFKKHDNTLI